MQRCPNEERLISSDKKGARHVVEAASPAQVTNVAQNVQINLVLEQGADKKKVVAQATAAGLAIEQELEALGVIVGSGPDEIVEKLKAIPGVSAVERGREVKIPPPDSPIQ